MLTSNVVDWMEWQAGHVCGAILMPANAVKELIKNRFAAVVSGELAIHAPIVNAMIEEVESTFQVSSEAARVRLERLAVLRDTVKHSPLF